MIINSIADLRERARRRLPRALFDYIDRGSYDERTWTRNRDDLRAIALRQRVMVDVSNLDSSITVLSESQENCERRIDWTSLTASASPGTTSS